jgi:hypothetical protein
MLVMMVIVKGKQSLRHNTGGFASLPWLAVIGKSEGRSENHSIKHFRAHEKNSDKRP